MKLKAMGVLATSALLSVGLAACGSDGDEGADSGASVQDLIDSGVITVDEETGLMNCNGTAEASTGPVGEDAIEKIESGTSVSFVDEGSASGYYYPATQWSEATGGDALLDLDAQFSGNHDNSVLAVARGDFPVGVSFDDARTGVMEDEPAVAENVVVFAYSTEIPNDGVVVAGSLPEETRTAITDAFLAMAEDEKGLKTLDAVYEIEGLEEVDLEALDAARQVAANFGEEGGVEGSEPEVSSQPPEELVLSLVPSGDVDEIVASSKGLESFLSKEIGIPVRAEVSDNYTASVVAMQADEAHILMTGPVGMVQAADQIGAVPILQSVRYGSSTYHTQWFTNDPATYCTSE